MRDLKYRKTAGRRLTTARHAGNVERLQLHVRTGDTVKVVRGDDKGKSGKVLRVFTKTGRVVVQGVNMVKRHTRARTAEEQGGIITREAAIHASNVMLLDPKSGAPTRIRRKVDSDGTKERVSVKSGDSIARPAR
jgi:large subunit ribosomal protein L24